QEIEPIEKYGEYYDEAFIIAGDFHFIRKYIPPCLSGKVIITNTITSSDVEELKKRKVEKLITTTPEIQGRSFGTNVIEAVLLILSKKEWKEITSEDYLKLIKDLDLKPRVEEFIKSEQ
ncbi:MAG TPA: quinate 5-dehydrogenase, partial [Candidatus Eremiobacteraeota bacterium]|nr:quinate 5-dehydrogenase [Candidatus Eremiobacteraeota bacterium]